MRSSDYVGRGVGKNGHISRVIPAALRGKRVVLIGGTDQPHAFTDVLDAARMLVATAEDPSAHGRTWIVPSNPPRSQKQALADVLHSVGKPPVPVTTLGGGVFAAAALFSPMLRELRELSYQWTRPYLVDDSAAREHFGFEPTPWDEVCRRTAEVHPVAV